MLNNIAVRPPVGFIVEGAGEYNCYPSLFCRIAGIPAAPVPIVNAGGCGTIVRRLDEQLNDLLLTDKPLSVIVTIDLEDVLKQHLASTSDELLGSLNNSIKVWKMNAGSNPRLQPLPSQIKIVIQVRKFETWLLTDIDGLKKEGLLKKNVDKILDAETIAKPSEWIKRNLSLDVKKPNLAKKVVTALNPEKMRLHSNSFNEFYQESKIAYSYWLENIQN